MTRKSQTLTTESVQRARAARKTLEYCRVPLGADYHTLDRSQVDLLEACAIEARYRKPRNANGSRARYFHDMLQRRACVYVPTSIVPNYPTFSDTNHVFCEACKLQVTGPFQASGRDQGRGSMRGQCTGQNGCKHVTYFDLSTRA